MQYISVKEAAQKWNTNIRVVQSLCANGRISGAKKFERVWTIPSNAAKPYDLRKKEAHVNKTPSYVPYSIFIDSLSFEPGQADSIVENFKVEEYQQIISELAYMRCDFEVAKEAYFKIPKDSELHICSMNIAAYAAIVLGDFELFNSVYKEFLELREASKDDELTKAIIDISIHTYMSAINVIDTGLKLDNISILPQASRKSFYYANCYYDLVYLKRYEKVAYGLEMLHGYLQLEEYTPRDIFLYLICAMAFDSMGQLKKAVYYVNKALDIALMDGFILPFARYAPVFGNTLLQCIRKRSEELYITIFNLSEKVYKNLIDFHNKFSQNYLSPLLSLDEIQIARLIVNGLTNTQIAAALGCSISSVKYKIEIIFDKLMITKRSEIEERIL